MCLPYILVVIFKYMYNLEFVNFIYFINIFVCDVSYFQYNNGILS